MGNDTWKEIESAGFWKPEKEGDILEGEIASINTEGKYGTQYGIKTSDGKIVNTPSHRVLQNRLASLKVGNKVRIVFECEELPQVKGQNPTKIYRVYTK